jgi:hypothetical protein
MTDLSEVITVSVFPTGRRVFAHRGVLKVAIDHGFTSLAAHLQNAIAQDEATLRLELQWEQTKAAPSPAPSAPALDTEVDANLVAIYDVCTVMAAMTAPGMPVESAKTVLAKAFPGGVVSIIRKSHEDECAAVDVLVAAFKNPQELAPHIAKLALEPVVAQLESSNARFREALNRPVAQTLTFDKVASARAEGQLRLLETLAQILGLAWAPADLTKRAQLLAPVLRQEADIRAANKRRKAVPDVDPVTGEPVGTTDPQPSPG